MLPQSWVHTMEVTLVRLHLYAAKNNVITTGEGKIYQKSSEVAPVDDTNGSPISSNGEWLLKYR